MYPNPYPPVTVPPPMIILIGRQALRPKEPLQRSELQELERDTLAVKKCSFGGSILEPSKLFYGVFNSFLKAARLQNDIAPETFWI